MKTQTKKLLISLENKNSMKMLMPLNIQMFSGDQNLYELKQSLMMIGQQLKKQKAKLLQRLLIQHQIQKILKPLKSHVMIYNYALM